MLLLLVSILVLFITFTDSICATGLDLQTDGSEIRRFLTDPSCQTHNGHQTCPFWREWSQWKLEHTYQGECVMARFRNCSTGHTSDCSSKGRGYEMKMCDTTVSDSHWTNWGGWKCETTAQGVCTMGRFRNCSLGLQGHCQGSDYELKQCDSNHCQNAAHWSEWGAWTCSHPHASSTYCSTLRYRTCSTNVDHDCPGHRYDVKSCTRCPGFHWSEWGAWSCSRQHGTCVTVRRRTCSSTAQIDCPGNSYDLRQCTTCPGVHWLEWGAWSCSYNNGNCINVRYRKCSTHVRDDCPAGKSYELTSCNNCPGAAHWLEWGAWTCQIHNSVCFSYRSRSCSTNVSNDCTGPNNEVELCRKNSCQGTSAATFKPTFMTSAMTSATTPPPTATPSAPSTATPTRTRTTHAPTHAKPTTQIYTHAPTTAKPTTQIYTHAPTTAKPTTQIYTHAPTTAKPTTQKYTHAPTTAKPTTQIYTHAPTTAKPTTQIYTHAPTTAKPTTQKYTHAPTTASHIHTLSTSDSSGSPTSSDSPKNTTTVSTASWSAWFYAPCSVTCGTGSRQGIRRCSTGNDHDCSGKGFTQESCMPRHCPVDGSWGAWHTWASCSQSCGDGVQTRRRSCGNPKPQYGGVTCNGVNEENRHCNLKDCPVWSPWFYGPCSVTCGTGSKQGIRRCSSGNEHECSGSAFITDSCNTAPCPVDGGWGSWLSWETCSETCGNGTRRRHRQCDHPKPQHNGAGCHGVAMESDQCHVIDCPHWSSYFQTGPCSVTCGKGVIQLQRNCSTGNNRDCTGSGYDEKPCALPAC